MKILSPLGLVMCAALPSAAFATQNAYRCNGCTETAYRNAATAPQTQGTRYVYDFVNHQFRKYQVSREPDGDGGFLYFADPLTIVATEQNYFNAADDAWNTNSPHSTKRTVSLNVNTVPNPPVPSGSSAYDIVPNSSLQNNISDWMQSVGQPAGPPYPTSFDQAVQAILALVRKPNGGVVMDNADTGTLTITFVFTNGHKVTFTWKQGLVPAFVDGRDANNNSVPKTPGDVDNHNFSFGHDPGDIPRFTQYVGRWGYNVSNTCNEHVIACVTLPDASRTCTAYPACP